MSITVTDEHVAALRAHLEGRAEEQRRLLDELGSEQARIGYRALVSAAFHLVVRRRFADWARAADVIEFVGEVRAGTVVAPDIDPRTAERMILAVGEGEEIDDVAAGTLFEHQLVLLKALVEDDLDGLLANARELADQWLG